MKKQESEYRDQFIQYVVTQVPLTGLWVTKGQILVREDGILKVFPLTNPIDNEFTTEDGAEIYILDAAKKATTGSWKLRMRCCGLVLTR
jgi:hypothetical protein